MYSVETCGCCIHEKKCAYESPCDDCNVLRSRCKESHFEEVGEDSIKLGKRGIYCDDYNKDIGGDWLVGLCYWI